MKNFIIILLSILVISCNLNKKEKKSHLVPVEEVSFNTSLSYLPNDSGCFIDSNDGREYFYFCNQATESRIDIFDANGNFIDTINIKKVLNKIGKPISLTVISMDTILMSTFYTNRLVAINSNGKIWYDLDIDSILPKKFKGKDEFWALPQTSFSCNRRSLYYKVLPRHNAFLSEETFNNKDISENNLMYCKICYNYPYFFKLTNYLSDTISFEFGLNDIYPQICKENSQFSEYPKYSYINDKIIFYSTFSDRLFVINSNNFKIEKEVTLHSKFTNIGTRAVELSKDSMFIQMEASRNAMKKAGRIINVLHNNYYYYVIIKFQDFQSTKHNKNKYLSFFSVIVLNNDFTVIDEILLDATKYNQYSGIITRKGLAFQKNNVKNGKTYTIFNFF